MLESEEPVNKIFRIGAFKLNVSRPQYQVQYSVSKKLSCDVLFVNFE